MPESQEPVEEDDDEDEEEDDEAKEVDEDSERFITEDLISPFLGFRSDFSSSLFGFGV